MLFQGHQGWLESLLRTCFVLAIDISQRPHRNGVLYLLIYLFIIVLIFRRDHTGMATCYSLLGPCCRCCCCCCCCLYPHLLNKGLIPELVVADREGMCSLQGQSASYVTSLLCTMLPVSPKSRQKTLKQPLNHLCTRCIDDCTSIYFLQQQCT